MCACSLRSLFRTGSKPTSSQYDFEFPLLWDAHKARACVCDPKYSGLDCSSRMCPRGDYAHFFALQKRHETQVGPGRCAKAACELVRELGRKVREGELRAWWARSDSTHAVKMSLFRLTLVRVIQICN